MSVQLDTDARCLAVLWALGGSAKWVDDELIERLAQQSDVDRGEILAEARSLVEEIQRELGNWPKQ